MENLINEVENQEVADKMVKLRPSQKQLLEGMKLANKESIADVLDRILEEREQLAKKLEKEFNKSAITKHNEAVMDHVKQIIGPHDPARTADLGLYRWSEVGNSENTLEL